MKTNNKIGALVQRYPIIPIAVLFFVVMVLFVPAFRTGTNLASFSAQMTYIGIAAAGLSFILIAAGNDLSCGMAMSANGVMTALIMTKIGSNVGGTVAGFISVFVIGLALAAINGYFIAYMKINNFMMTLITQYCYKGLALILTGSKSVTGLPSGFLNIASAKIIGIPLSFIVLILIYVVGQVILSKTRYGRELFATGANERAARLVGINTSLTFFKAYLFGGFCNALSTIVLIGKLGVVNPTMGNELFTDIISSAIIGGNSLFGGKGSVIGTAFGVVVIGLISNSLNLLGVSYQNQKWIKGIIILVAIVLDTVQGKLAAKRMLRSGAPAAPAPASEK